MLYKRPLKHILYYQRNSFPLIISSFSNNMEFRENDIDPEYNSNRVVYHYSNSNRSTFDRRRKKSDIIGSLKCI